MSKLTKSVKAMRDEAKFEKMNPVVNYMDGISYEINPLDTLKMVTASSIFGEPQYYRNGEFAESGISDGICRVNELFAEYDVFGGMMNSKTTSVVMEEIIDKALDYDFGAVLNWAVELRKNYMMRLNPQVIMVRAAQHPGRVDFTKKNPTKFAEVEKIVMSRADEPASQLAYYLYKNDGKKNNIPNILKRAWANKLSSLNAYQVHKYKNAGIGMIDTVRICHANSPVLDELMKTGTVAVDESNNTWESLHAQGKNWKEIFELGVMGHMALLRNLRNIFTEVKNDDDFRDRVLKELKEGVLNGKQFPFRYYTAMRVIKSSECAYKSNILDALEECIDISLQNMPKLKGKTMCLSDNSGSAWGSFNSEYGTVTVADIDNLSSVITAVNSDEGYVGKFGDGLKIVPAKKRDGILGQAEKISEGRSSDVGGGTENGIWIFFRDAIDKKEHWDNIFIYSDQQAGHGGLYGTDEGTKEYTSAGFNVANSWRSDYIDVAKLIAEYRKKVNPNVNVFSIQTAGYDNVVIPEYGFRTNIMYGWTGKELIFADKMIKLWDDVQKR